ncbi:MAG: alpha-amylase family glycosyl hydrolase [Cellvibrio sp.]|uniref:alpha-amylase family glycosyl hydrolase n=1 Tax=Cellvibrio sp. TaxID=1965322 RepID=UPI0027220217|nr:alpha-amylase family glycosyl hydrolase [Cellvibrio sp.]
MVKPINVFKFDTTTNWSVNYGDSNNDGILNQNGSDIFSNLVGTYRVQVNDVTLAYTLTAITTSSSSVSSSTSSIKSSASSSLVLSSVSSIRSSLASSSAASSITGIVNGDFRKETIYFLLTARFYDGDTGNNYYNRDRYKAGDPHWRGDFKGLIQKLDYIKDLGFTAIWVTPPVENRSGLDYHGYHAYDFYKVDPRMAGDTIDLATGRQNVKDYLNGAMKMYLDMGVDAIRLDTVNISNATSCLVTSTPGKRINPGCLYSVRIW